MRLVRRILRYFRRLLPMPDQSRRPEVAVPPAAWCVRRFAVVAVHHIYRAIGGRLESAAVWGIAELCKSPCLHGATSSEIAPQSAQPPNQISCQREVDREADLHGDSRGSEAVDHADLPLEAGAQPLRHLVRGQIAPMGLANTLPC